MRRTFIPVLVLALATLTVSTAYAQEKDFEAILKFEVPQAEGAPRGWGGGPPGTIHFDGETVHGGHGAVRLERDADSPGEFTTITKRIPVDFAGEWIEFRGFLRTEGVTGYAGLWMREDGRGGAVQFDNMQDRGVKGDTEWTEYTIRLPLDDRGVELYFGVLVAGEGTVWADDLQLLVDGKPVAEAPERSIEEMALDTDKEFDAGSGVTVTSLTEDQVEHAAVLGMVWGFLKYHHLRIAGGEFHWDYELFRVLPKVLDASDRDGRNRILSEWVGRLGVPESCDPCAGPPKDAHLLPRLGWLEDTELLGAELSGQLKAIHENRFAGGRQFYVGAMPGVGNPVFDRDLPYAGQVPPDAGYRILALMRMWNIIEYWFPYRDQLEDDWRAVLREYLPRFVKAADWDAYRLEMLSLVARVGDTHANLWGSLDVRPPRGECRWPVSLRVVEGRFTVTAYTDEEKESNLRIGDVIQVVDGRPVESLVEEWRQYYCASNETTKLRDIARFLPRGDCGESKLTILRRGESLTVTVNRLAGDDWTPALHDRPGETFQLLSPEVAYLKLSSVRLPDVPQYIEKAAGTRGLVVDIRNYPSAFVVFALGTRFVREPTPFARFTVGDLENPGTFSWTPPLHLQPVEPGYTGKVVILVDEVSISNAEYTAMALSAGPNAVVAGSTTAGADGNVSPIPLPGGIRSLISGIGVFYPDKTPTQRVGIIPDIVATPTLDGILEGRDEVLESAIRHILGPEAEEDVIRNLAKYPRGES
jgi:C-terminal processing protease CtpA/Prc